MTEPQPAEITVNGSARILAKGETVTELVGEITGRRIAGNGQATDGKRLGVAVARNAGVVPRSQWATTTLMPGDDVEIVTATQGG
ncbi:sulfur carrier protein [Cryobacterium psychrotolerans]|uniref:Sulfur carrier protein n=1 Tax=Cryobacterium psychrotolerans TaxID=386301 RepID=A0A1G9DEX2_9MICO|nr:MULTISPECIES: sulfur carrier protein ThiS [Cryobacterium]TFD44310.1 sulfur carrier protein ThiS [Cryobacterium sp. TMT1-2-1]TFD89542.1 sulfur carrier protein ThiS [Cryobacterium psychrotolerans]SDK62428.1 sulfur carrier protein [Cryobacterium psychrotolerans]